MKRHPKNIEPAKYIKKTENLYIGTKYSAGGTRMKVELERDPDDGHWNVVVDRIYAGRRRTLDEAKQYVEDRYNPDIEDDELVTEA